MLTSKVSLVVPPAPVQLKTKTVFWTMFETTWSVRDKPLQEPMLGLEATEQEVAPVEVQESFTV